MLVPLFVDYRVYVHLCCQFDICLAFGETELTARVRWEENVGAFPTITLASS
jgi:hypothetical protein